MKPARYNIKFYRGTTLDIVMTYLINNVPVDLANYTATMDVRPAPNSATLIDQLTTENGRILIDEALGEVNLLISAADTSSLTAGSYVYDLELVSGSRVTRLIQGRFVVDRGTTR